MKNNSIINYHSIMTKIEKVIWVVKGYWHARKDTIFIVQHQTKHCLRFQQVYNIIYIRTYVYIVFILHFDICSL